MKEILEYKLHQNQAALWWLGQAGYIVRDADLVVLIDPYLSDIAAGGVAGFARAYPPPLVAQNLKADIYIITHDHMDHLDPVTIQSYTYKNDTWFVAPRLAAKKLPGLGINPARIVVINAGENRIVNGLSITGVFALPTGKDVIDTTGYLIQFANGRTIYHTSDTQYHQLVLEAAPRHPDIMLVPINGKWKNTNVEEAALFAKAVQPRYVMPNHYDLMPFNTENPETFEWYCKHYELKADCVIPQRMQAFVWGDHSCSPGIHSNI